MDVDGTNDLYEERIARATNYRILRGSNFKLRNISSVAQLLSYRPVELPSAVGCCDCPTGDFFNSSSV